MLLFTLVTSHGANTGCACHSASVPLCRGDVFIIEYKIKANGILEIIDQMGKVAGKLNVSTEQQFIKLNATRFSNGLYSFHITTTDGKILKGKFEVIK